MRVAVCLTGERRRAAFEQDALRRIAVAVASETSPEGIFNLVAEELARVLAVAGGAVVRFDDGEATFVGRWSARAGAWPSGDLTVPLTDPLTSLQVDPRERPPAPTTSAPSPAPCPGCSTPARSGAAWPPR